MHTAVRTPLVLCVCILFRTWCVLVPSLGSWVKLGVCRNRFGWRVKKLLYYPHSRFVWKNRLSQASPEEAPSPKVGLATSVQSSRTKTTKKVACSLRPFPPTSRLLLILRRGGNLLISVPHPLPATSRFPVPPLRRHDGRRVVRSTPAPVPATSELDGLSG